MHKLQIQSTVHNTGLIVHSAHERSSTEYQVHSTRSTHTCTTKVHSTQYKKTQKKCVRESTVIYTVNVRTQYTVHTT